MQLDGCAYVRGWYLWCSACVSDGGSTRSINLCCPWKRRHVDGLARCPSVPPCPAAHLRRRSGHASVCVSVRRVRVLKGLCSVCFLCVSMLANCHQVLVLCDNQYNSHFWPSVEFGSCFSLRHHSGLSEIPVFHTFRTVFLCGSLAGVPRGILHRVCSCRSALRRQRGRDANHSPRHLLDHSTCVANLEMFPVL